MTDQIRQTFSGLSNICCVVADRLELAVNQHFFGSSKTAPTNNSVVFLLLYQTRRFHEEDPVVCGAERDEER